MVFSYQVIKFQSVSMVQGTQWSQSITDKGVLYKALRNPYSKLLIQPINGTKKLFRVPKDRTVIITSDVAHFLGELS